MSKHVALISTSRAALLSELRDVRPVILPDAPPENEPMAVEVPDVVTAQDRHLLGPLLCVFAFFIRFFSGQNPARTSETVFEYNPELDRPYPPNRLARRFWKRYPTSGHLPISDRAYVYRYLFPRNISWARFKEMRAREGNWNRVIVMGFRARKFRKFEPGAQMGASFLAAICGAFKPASVSISNGLWAVQLPPD